MTAGDQNVGKVKPMTLKVLSVVRDSQLAHGLRHNDYQLYRQYCTRRLRRIRKNLGLIQGDKKNFKKKDVTVNNLSQREERYLYIPLITVERSWAYAMQLKEESMQDPRKKFAMRNKLRKASKYVTAFQKLVESCGLCDARTQLEVQGYSSWLQGTVLFEMAEYTHEWEAPVVFFNEAHAIYSKLSSAVSEDESSVYQSRLQELEVKLRYCRHHLGDRAATDTLLAMRGNEALGGKLDKLVAAARERQASTLSEVTWKGRTLAVKHEKVRLFLLNEGLAKNELKKTSQPELRAEILEKLLMECKDALQIVREDLKMEPTFKIRQQASEGSVTPLHFLYTYLSHLRINLTILRNLAYYHSYRAIINGDEKVEEGKKAPKIQDIIRLCDIIIQHLNELPLLSGLEDDLELKRDVEGQKLAYKSHRSFYIAENFAKIEKWAEALCMYDRTQEYVQKARKYRLEDAIVTSLKVLDEEINSKKYTAHAKLILTHQTKKVDSPKLREAEKKMLINRLDVYIEDPSLCSTNPRVAPVPPSLEPVSFKPLFFDLALNHVDFPSLDSECQETAAQSRPNNPKANSKQEAAQGGGIRGLVRGLWGWGS